MLSAPAPAGSLLGYRDRVAVLLAWVIELWLAGGTPEPGLPQTASPWDVWWVCYRAALPADQIGLDPNRAGARCRRCRQDVIGLTTGAAIGHPEQLAPGGCRCLTAWAARMRAPAPDLAWPPLRLSLALVKPHADADRLRRLLQPTSTLLQVQRQRLSRADVRRLYPDAYGADYVAGQDAYLTSSEVHVLILAATAAASEASARQVKTGIRARLGGADRLRNHLHMPDNPGETLCDLAHLAGLPVLRELYGRFDRDRAAGRLAGYRAVLARR